MKQAFINGIILDGTLDMEPLEDFCVLTDGGVISDIVPSENLPEEYKKIDLGGKYIMPGLINMHVHIPATGKPEKKKSDPAKKVRFLMSNPVTRAIVGKMYQSYARTELMSGVTTLRSVGGVTTYDTQLRDKIAAGSCDGPRILAGDMGVSVPGGHMAGSLAYEATSAEEAVNYVKIIAEAKPDILKLMITGGVLDAKVKGEPGELKMPAEYVKACCDTAHGLGIKVAAHVESPEGVKTALENGVDTIEHGAKPDEDIIRLFKEKNAALICTISPALPYALMDRSISGITETEQYNGNVVFRGVIDCANACLEAGIPVGLGTDTGCPYITHYDMWRELYYFTKYCNVSNAFALHTATMVNASIAGIDDIAGCISPGKSADFVVTEKNPLEDICALRNISMVVTRGKVFDAPYVKKMEEVETELDKLM